ncbi:MAG TPA: DUF4215 domain-containing protein, partial [Kofleriaceae bacterium]
VVVGPVCGNGVIEGLETCDDDNAMSGDGCSATCQEESIVAFAFTGATGSETTFNAEAVSPQLMSPIAFSRGAGLTAATASGTFNSSSWSLGFDTNDYVTFTLAPTGANKMTMLALVFDQQRSATGPDMWSVRSSLDNYATDIQTGTLPTSGAFVTTRVTLGAGFANLITPITLRIYGWDAAASGGTLRFDNVSVIGSVEP